MASAKRSGSSTRQACGSLARRRGSRRLWPGTVGPLGIRLEPLGPTSFEEARAIFREQIEALVEAGVDLLILETFRDSNEIREAIFAAREAAGDDIAIIAQVSIEDDGRLRDGTSTEDFTRRLDEWPVDVIGLNCSSGPKVMLEAIEKMLAFTKKPLSAMPNAGLPATVEGPQHLSVLARIHGAICAPLSDGGRPHRRRMLRHHRRRTSRKFAAKRAACSRRFARSDVTVEEPAYTGQVARKDSDRRKKRAGREARGRKIRRVRRNSAAARRSTRRRRLKARSCARPPASIASTCPTALAPAPA